MAQWKKVNFLDKREREGIRRHTSKQELSKQELSISSQACTNSRGTGTHSSHLYSGPLALFMSMVLLWNMPKLAPKKKKKVK